MGVIKLVNTAVRTKVLRSIGYTGFVGLKNRFRVLMSMDTLLVFQSVSQWHRRMDRGDLAVGQSRSLFRTISKSNQDMVRKSAGYCVINQLSQGGDAINVASKRLWKGLNLTCNLTGQRVCKKEGSGSNGNVGVIGSRCQGLQKCGIVYWRVFSSNSFYIYPTMTYGCLLELKNKQTNRNKVALLDFKNFFL